MNHRNNMKTTAYKNFVYSIVAQFVTILSGIIVPRLLLQTFGSEVNGLVSSITQFLNYISLVEGGVGSVIVASLYAPLSTKNYIALNSVLNAGEFFFRKIGVVLLIYCFALGIVYPYIVHANFSVSYIFVLVVILSINPILSYFFVVNYKYLLLADQKIYIVHAITIASTVFTIAITCYLVRISNSIHVVKAFCTIPFLIQPVFFSNYCKERYHIDKKIEKNIVALKNRWDAFGQNTAYFIHANTDIVIISLFMDLTAVSAYTVHLLVINGLKSFMSAISSVFSPIIGRYYALKDENKLVEMFDHYVFLTCFVASIMFGCCVNLLSSFVAIYTHGINDANYYYPVFGIIITIAEYVYCIRDPYVQLVYSAKLFKETSKASYLEAIINITVSIAFVRAFGLVGIAIGTFIAMFIRFIYLVVFANRIILRRNMKCCYKRSLISFVSIVISSVLFFSLRLNGDTIFAWIFMASISFSINLLILTVLFFLFDKEEVKYYIYKIITPKQ